MGSTGKQEALTRRMLEGFGQVGGLLSDGALGLATSRHFNIQPNRRALPPYPEADWQRLTEVCRTLTDKSYAAHRQALSVASRGQHPAEGGWKPENLRCCWPGSAR